jgi:peptidoglycan/xylan/chitin deacetylase (PgdA/CDA1 family)
MDLAEGSWFDVSFHRRLARRVLIRIPPRLAAALSRFGERPSRLLSDGALWRRVRQESTRREWQRRSRSSYSVIYYHRLQGDNKPGQERLDVPPSTFARQMRLLRRLRFRPLSQQDLVAFHRGDRRTLPARSFVITCDDGFADCVGPLLEQAWARPHLYIPSAEVGGRAWWAGSEPLADWGDLKRLVAAGVIVGSHARHHVDLSTLDGDPLMEELAGSRLDLEDRLQRSIESIAYPHGRFDERVTQSAAAAGYRLAFTTDPGRNGAGTPVMQLKRVGVKAWDSQASFLWKVSTGELLPGRWEARRIRRARPVSRRPRPKSSPGAA